MFKRPCVLIQDTMACTRVYIQYTNLQEGGDVLTLCRKILSTTCEFQYLRILADLVPPLRAQ